MRGWVPGSHRKAEGFSACTGQSLMRREGSPTAYSQTSTVIPQDRPLPLGCNFLCGASCRVNTDTQLWQEPCHAECFLDGVPDWDQHRPSHRNKADGGAVMLCRREPGGDISPATAFSILTTNKHSHLKFSMKVKVKSLSCV